MEGVDPAGWCSIRGSTMRTSRLVARRGENRTRATLWLPYREENLTGISACGDSRGKFVATGPREPSNTREAIFHGAGYETRCLYIRGTLEGLGLP